MAGSEGQGLDEARVEQSGIDGGRALDRIIFGTCQTRGAIAGRIQARLDRNADADPIPAKLYDIGNENEINNLDYGFQLQDPDRAIEIFARNVAASPKSWKAHDSLAEAYAAKGDKDEARKHYKHALEMAPEAQHSRIEGVLGGLGD